MKTVYWNALLVTALIACGCEPSESPETPGGNDPTNSVQSLNHSSPPGPSGHAANPPASTDLDASIQAVKARLRKWEMQVADLGTRIQQLGDQAGVEGREALADLKSRLASLSGMMNDLKDQGKDAWKEIEPTIESGLDELQTAYDKVAAKFKE